MKLWALEGISNIKKEGGRSTVNIESKVARTISLFLDKQKELPWPIQMRGLEALGWLRQSGLPAEASKAYMANTAMQFLADTGAKFEVRAEAARALGLMQVNAVPKYNFKLVAHYAGLLAADLASEINEQFSDSPPRSENPTRAQYMTALLVGPVVPALRWGPGREQLRHPPVGEGRHRVPEVHPEGLRDGPAAGAGLGRAARCTDERIQGQESRSWPPASRNCGRSSSRIPRPAGS